MASGTRRADRVGAPPARAQSRMPPAEARVQTPQLRPGAASKRKPVPSPPSSSPCGLRQGAEAAVPAAELRDRGREIVAVEVGPHAGGEEELGVRALPQEKGAQSLLASGADHQIHVARGRAVDLSEPDRSTLSGRVVSSAE